MSQLMAHVIVPATVTDTVLDDSNVAEDDHAEWDAGTAYSEGNRVIVSSVHKVYEASGSTTGDDPVTSTGKWIEVGATNRWKAFDRRVSDPVQNEDSIEYDLVPESMVQGIAFFGLSAASIRVEVFDQDEYLIWEHDAPLTDTSDIIDWWTFFTWEAPQKSDLVLFDIPGFVGNRINVLIDAPYATARVGQIVLGKVVTLGRAHADTRVGFTDYSRKDRDDFGNAIIIERAFSARATYIFSFPRADTGRILRTISSLRATPAVYTLGPETSHLGTTVYGFLSGDLDIPLIAADVATASLEIEGLI